VWDKSIWKCSVGRSSPFFDHSGIWSPNISIDTKDKCPTKIYKCRCEVDDAIVTYGKI